MIEKQSPKDSPAAEQLNTRWWESYLVRYFVGFIVGIGCVALIAHQLDLIANATALLGGNGVQKPDWSAVVFLLALAGLGYCYIASTPITVLHSGRYGRGPIDRQSRYFWISWIALLLVVNTCDLASARPFASMAWIGILYAVAGLIGLENEPQLEGRQDDFGVVTMKIFAWFVLQISTAFLVAQYFKPDSISLRLLAFSLPVFWIGLVQYVVLWRILFEQQKIEAFYIRLFNARRLPNARDVRDTYTHLREHSNSVFIVLVELCLLSLFLAVIRVTRSATNAPIDLYELGPYLLAGIGIWMVPTVFMWSRANYMEVRFSNDPESFLGVKSKVSQKN